MIHANCARAFVIIKWTRFIHWDSITFVVAMFCALCVQNDRQRTNGEKSHPSATIALVRDFVHGITLRCMLRFASQSVWNVRACVWIGEYEVGGYAVEHTTVWLNENITSFLAVSFSYFNVFLILMFSARNPPFNPIPFHRRFCS